ncbi:hypothetical protein QWY93_14660 [Echinicola jeungdonensis]|uniref:Uncharacterized protein n=1 Tax=Echinicola jeungdonensis TaxID=709343 RepID=A0ABV5J306_9BACT|nr:hypothetical protein [Echinicola jeungdonensis]MDN3670562.1 hypothetical protein [Echinicola jeungdonensis]
MQSWLAILEKMIWPIFIIVLLFVFRDKINGLYEMATEGRSVEIAGWLKIGEKVQQTEINQFATKDLSIEAVEGSGSVIEKGGENRLIELQEKLRNSEIKSFDILKITNNKIYYKDLLEKYISTLGIKHIVFIKDGKFDGWMASSIFSGQLLVFQQNTFGYDQLRNSLAGIRKTQIGPQEKTSVVLKKMRDEQMDNIAIVENDTFKYIINKQDIITAIVSNSIPINGE